MKFYDREKANLNEIDIVAVNDIEKRLVLAEVKRQRENHHIGALKQKAKGLVMKFNDYAIEYLCLSMDDM